jgi:hypothetical protein
VTRLVRIVARPFADWLDALESCLRGGRWSLALIVVSLLLAWWLYVPLHELGHAGGCLLAGGQVTRLEISEIYGATWLARVFPFVTVGSEYAGRLSGFDTRGSDLVYLVTCAAPFVLTVLVGVPLLHAVPRVRGWWGGVVLGAAIPMAFAPFVSLPGDYYEMGSILVSRAMAAAVPGFAIDRWRGDDLVKLAGTLAPDGRVADALGLAVSLLVGATLALATYWAGVAAAGAIGGAAKAPRSPTHPVTGDGQRIR